MSIMETAIAMNNDFLECSNSLERIDLFAEAAYKEYNINLKEVALKVLTESGTEDDYNFLATEAAANFIERAGNAIKKFIETILKFIRNCADKLIKLVTNEKTEKALARAEEACESNSKLNSVKVKYVNTDKQVSAVQQGIDKINKKVAKVKAKGIATDADFSDVEEIKSNTLKKVGGLAAAAVTTVGLGALIALCRRNKSKNDINVILDENKIVDGCDVGTLNNDNAKDANTANFFVKATGALSELSKELVSLTVTKSTSAYGAIKNLFSKFKKKTSSDNLNEDDDVWELEEVEIDDLEIFGHYNEYATEELEEIEEIEEITEEDAVETESMGEVEGLDLDAYFTELCHEIETMATESVEETTTDTTDVETPTEQPETTDVVDEEPVSESAEEETPAVEVEEVATESTVDHVTELELYMEQLEKEVFGDEDTDVVSESTSETTLQDLIDEMEALL